MTAPAPLEPIALLPHLAPRVWGGARLGPGVGEAWDLSVHPNGPSRVADGPWAGRTLDELAAAHPGAFGGPIGLLAKRLDCAQTLSVQVHPRGRDAKTEAWVVLDAAPGAGVYVGFRRRVTKEEVRQAALDGTLPQLLRFVEAGAGAAIFVPSGTVHAIGAGLFLFEIQQSSDVTYRMFDWGRSRELHLDAALDCAILEPADLSRPPGARLAVCEHFVVERAEGEAILDPGTRWRAALDVATGRTTLVPATAGPRRVRGERLLVYGP